MLTIHCCLALLLPLVPVAQQVPTVEAVRATTAPILDGTLEDEAWAQAHALTDFIQFEPLRGRSVSQPTEVRVLYDDAAVYIGFRFLESESPNAELTRRDSDLLTDDAAILVLDTYADRQSGYVFAVNLLGTQMDGRIAGDGREVDYAWDGEWRSAVSRTDSGWEAEIAIPFASLRYVAGEDMAWGFNAGRSRRANLEVGFWSGPLESLFRVSGAGRLEGLRLPPPPRRHHVIPYGLTQVERGARTQWAAGIDARYRITPAVTIDGTVNPDFATIEADQEQVNLTRFELSLPEKRPFFLEGSELFRQRIRTFYSRRITDIRGGGKVAGRQGPWTFLVMGTGAETAGVDHRPLYGVARIQRDVGRSSIGGTWAGRRFSGTSEGSASVDATLFFTSRLGMTAQAVESYGAFSRGTHAFYVRPSYDSPTGHFHVRYTDMGDRFADNANAVGFVVDDNRRELDAAIDKTVWFDTGALERLQYDSNYNVYWGQAGDLRSWQVDESFALELRSKWSVSLTHTEEFKRFERDFRNRASGLSVGYNTRAFQSAAVGYRTGRNFGSDFDLITASAALNPTASSALEYELQRLVLDPDPQAQTTWIHVARGNVYFTPDLYLQLFFQRNSRLDRDNLQAIFVYRYLPPFGTVQVAFQNGTAEFGQESSQGNTLFVKLSAVF